LLTPEVVQYGLAAEVLDQMDRVLASAYQAHPERFVKCRLQTQALYQAVWINGPAKQTNREKNYTNLEKRVSQSC